VLHSVLISSFGEVSYSIRRPKSVKNVSNISETFLYLVICSMFGEDEKRIYNFSRERYEGNIKMDLKNRM
jgi:hypothetical protein